MYKISPIAQQNGGNIFVYRQQKFFSQRAQSAEALQKRRAESAEALQELLTESIAFFMEECRAESAEAMQREAEALRREEQKQKKAENRLLIKGKYLYMLSEAEALQKREAEKQKRRAEEEAEALRRAEALHYASPISADYLQRRIGITAQREAQRKAEAEIMRKILQGAEEAQERAEETAEQKKAYFLRRAQRDAKQINSFSGIAWQNSWYHNDMKQTVVYRLCENEVKQGADIHNIYCIAFPYEEEEEETEYMHEVYAQSLERYLETFAYAQIIAVLKQQYRKSGNPFIWKLLKQAQMQFINRNRLNAKQDISTEAKVQENRYDSTFRKYFKRSKAKITFRIVHDSGKELDTAEKNKKDCSFAEYFDINDLFGIAELTVQKLYSCHIYKCNLQTEMYFYRNAVQKALTAYIDSMKSKRAEFIDVPKTEEEEQEYLEVIEQKFYAEDSYSSDYEALLSIVKSELQKQKRKQYKTETAMKCFELYAVDGLTYAEIAQIVGISLQRCAVFVKDVMQIVSTAEAQRRAING